MKKQIKFVETRVHFCQYRFPVSEFILYFISIILSAKHNEKILQLIPDFIQYIWLGIHNLADNRRFQAMNGESFYNNWSESNYNDNYDDNYDDNYVDNYDDSRAAAINVRQSKWTSKTIEEQMGYMCIYRLFSKYLLKYFLSNFL